MKHILTKKLFEENTVELKGDLTIKYRIDILYDIFDNPWRNWYSLNYDIAPSGYKQGRGLDGIWRENTYIYELEVFIAKIKVFMSKNIKSENPKYTEADIEELDEFRSVINPNWEEQPKKITKDSDIELCKKSIQEFIENGGATGNKGKYQKFIKDEKDKEIEKFTNDYEESKKPQTK